MPAHRPIAPLRQSRSQFCATLESSADFAAGERSKAALRRPRSDLLERCNPDGLLRKLPAVTRIYQ